LVRQGLRYSLAEVQSSSTRLIGQYDLDGDSRRETGGPFVLRAAKNAEVLRSVIDRISQGGAVALVPESSSDDFVDDILGRLAALAADHGNDGLDGVLVLPTSGSTGRPKLVALKASRIETFISWAVAEFGFGAGTCSISLSPWNFDVCLLDTWAVLAAGGTVLTARPARLRDPGYLADLMAGREITFVQTVPSTLEDLVRARAGGRTFPSVRDLVLTGGAAGTATRAAAVEMFPRARFHNVYGSTEVNDCLIQRLSAEEFAGATTLPLGTPIPGCDLHLENDGVVRPLGDWPDGTEGELLVRTPWMAAGYITGGRVEPITEPDEPALYRMRDRVALRGGRIHFAGRTDRTVKLRGQRLNLDEVEHAARATGIVGDACAWIETAESGEHLHLAYTQVDQAGPTGLQLRMLLSRRLPPYAMPNRLHPFDRPFPLNGNGKPHLKQIQTIAGEEKAHGHSR
jgi:acyl-coenzyme A synthetase/AMP-(fatty) acid ligase